VLVVLFIFLAPVVLLLATRLPLSALLTCSTLLAGLLIFAIALLTALAALFVADVLLAAALLSALLAFAITLLLIRMLALLVCHLCSPYSFELSFNAPPVTGGASIHF
jgi:hypothetical protein